MQPRNPDEGMTVERRSDALVARFPREVVLSGPEAEAAAQRLTDLLAEADGRPLLIDFGNVRSLTSMMLGKLAGLSRAANTAGVRLALFNLSTDVRGILEVTRLNLLICLYGGESEALQGPSI